MSGDKSTADYVQKSNRMEEYDKSRADIFDTGFWVCVCFETRAQVEEWLELNGYDRDMLYINGLELADKRGESLSAPTGVNLDSRMRSTVNKKTLDELRERR